MSWLLNYYSRVMLRHPSVLLALTGLAWRIKSVFTFGTTTAVLGHTEVREVLRRSDGFELGPIARKKMLAGKFLLGMDAWPIYNDDKDILKKELSSWHGAKLQKIVVPVCEEALDALKKDITNRQQQGVATIDLVKDFAEPVVTRIAHKLFLGVDKLKQLDTSLIQPDASLTLVTRDEQILSQWLLKVGSVIATEYPAQFGLQDIAEEAKDELINNLVRELCRNSEEKVTGAMQHSKSLNNVLDNIVVAFSNSSIEENVVDRAQRNIVGLMLAGALPLVNSIVTIVDQLLRRPDVHLGKIPMKMPSTGDVSFGEDTMAAIDSSHHFRSISPPSEERKTLQPIAFELARIHADASAQLGSSTESNKDLSAAAHTKQTAERIMDQLALEAMRFKPTFPFLARYCTHGDAIGPAGLNRVSVATGSTVVVCPLSAMHDSEYFPDADQFAHRPANSYLHFGSGGHRCLGQDVATEILTQMALHIFTLDTIERVPKNAFSFDGPSIENYLLRIRVP